ncbi:hypothetical protein R6Q59_011324 [Mikania micrantha]
MKAPVYFFKFISPISNSHLSIPKSFRKHLKSRRKNRVVILRRGNQKWEVKMGKDWVFGEGWDSFMADNGVQDFDIVVFKHQENMVFDIIVFDTTWCEREYVNNQVTKRFKKRKLNNNGSPKALLSNPYFTSTVTASAIKSPYANIPLAFARSNKLDMRNCELYVMDEKQRLWPTQLRRLGGHVRINRMRAMWVANGLKEGDEFSLELVDNGNKPLMNFHRTGPDTEPNVLLITGRTGFKNRMSY